MRGDWHGLERTPGPGTALACGDRIPGQRGPRCWGHTSSRGRGGQWEGPEPTHGLQHHPALAVHGCQFATNATSSALHPDKTGDSPSRKKSPGPCSQELRVTLEGHGSQTRKPPSWTVMDRAGRGQVVPTVARQGCQGWQGGPGQKQRQGLPQLLALGGPPESGDTRLCPLQAQSALSPHYTGATNGPLGALGLARPGTKPGRRGQRSEPGGPRQAGTVSPP